MTRLSVGVIGAGRVGAVLAARLLAAGYQVTSVSGRSDASLLRIRTLLPDLDVRPPAEVAAAVDVLVLAVPDDSLVRVAEELAAVVRPGQYVLHTSGRHGLGALDAITRRGVRPIAFHPAMTFTGTSVDLDRTCVVGLTAGEAERPFAEELVAALGCTAMWVDEADRALYHAGLAHGANHLVTLVAQSLDLLRASGAADPAAVLRPLLGAALDNALAYGDAALTGPVVRGDVTTVRAHLDAFASSRTDPATVDAYTELARASSVRAEQSGRLAPSDADAIRQVLAEAGWDALAELAGGRA